MPRTDRRTPLEDPTADWPARLRPGHRERDTTIEQLRRLLLAGAHADANRRADSLPDAVLADLDDLCEQAADDAVTAVLTKLDRFRGDSRFSTWAYTFVIFEISTRLRRHAWRDQRVDLSDVAWERQLAPDDRATTEQRALLDLVGEGMGEALTERQRIVFRAAVLNEVPIDVIAERLDSTRGAVYKLVHDARRKLRNYVTDQGYGDVLS